MVERRAPGVAPAEEGDQLVTFGIGPAGAKRGDDRPFLTYGVAPGGEVLDHVAVVNQSNQPLRLVVYAGDGLNTATGGLDVKKRAERNTDVGAWITVGEAAKRGGLDPSSRSTVAVIVPPQNSKTGRGTVIVPIRISVPRDASPGDHVGGVVASLITLGKNPASQNIELEQRVATRVYLQVAGALRPRLAVQVVDVDHVGGGGLGLSGRARVTYRITNSGNTLLGASSRVRVRGPFGLAEREVAGADLEQLVPGGSALVTTTVERVRPTVLARAEVAVTSLRAPGAGDAPDTAASTTARFWAFTWQEAVVFTLLVLLAVGLVLYRRWRRGRPEGSKHGRRRQKAPPAHGARRAPRHRVSAARMHVARRPGPRRGVAIAVVLGAASVPSMTSPGVASAATTIGTIAVSPSSGTDERLFSGTVADARCPSGTADSYFSIDGPGLPRDQAILGAGNVTGTGPQSFQGASIANIKATNSGSFARSGRYTIRFNCVRSPDGRVTHTYERTLEYVAGGRGSFSVQAPPRFSPPSAARSTPSAAAPAPSVAPSERASAAPGVGAATGAAQGVTAERDPDTGGGRRIWLAVLAFAVGAIALFGVFRARRTSRDTAGE